MSAAYIMLYNCIETVCYSARYDIVDVVDSYMQCKNSEIILQL